MKMTRAVRRGSGVGILGLALVTAAGCDDDPLLNGCFCTEEFRAVSVTVVDTAGSPVDSMSVVVTRPRDGFTFTPDQELAFDPGTYVIMDDGDKTALTISGETVRVVATKGGASVNADYVFATDDCRCHIEKVSGPDTLVWVPGG